MSDTVLRDLPSTDSYQGVWPDIKCTVYIVYSLQFTVLIKCTVVNPLKHILLFRVGMFLYQQPRANTVLVVV